MSIPSLIELQRRSYYDFLQSNVPPQKREDIGLQAALKGVFPVQDFSGRVQLEFGGYILEGAKCDLVEARQKGLTYSSPLRAKLRLVGFEEDRSISLSKSRMFI